ncbi:MAG: hypothetical protein IKA71_02745 [Lentisphaeria bacterium]|nr:hypothetical protein [Lentisphaeria bacterium]
MSIGITVKKYNFLVKYKQSIALFIIVIIAVILRMVYLIQSPIETRDGIAYINFTHKWFELGQAALPAHETVPPPLYCYLGKSLMYCGLSAANALLYINMISGILLLIPAYLIGRYIYNDRNAGLWFAAFAAVMPPLVEYSCVRLREGLYLFLLFWIVCLWIMTLKRVLWKLNAFIIGALCIPALYCRYEAVEFLPFVLVGLPLAMLFPNWQWKNAFVTAVLISSGVIVCGMLFYILPGMPDIFNIFYNRIFAQCLGTSLNPL